MNTTTGKSSFGLSHLNVVCEGLQSRQHGGKSGMLGGRDEVARGGTWPACLRRARVAFLTNVMELHTLTDAKSRGDLPLRFLESTKSLREFAEEVVEEAHQYNGFNLIIADLSPEDLVYVSNRPEGDIGNSVWNRILGNCLVNMLKVKFQ